MEGLSLFINTYIFTYSGSIGLLLCIVFYFIGSSNPETHPHISNAERDYLLSENNTDTSKKTKDLAYPWKEILKSRKVYTLWFAHMCDGWGFYLICVCLPSFMKEVLNLNKVEVNILFYYKL